MRIDLGIDIIQFQRIEKIYYKYGYNLIIRFLSSYEIKMLPSKKYVIAYLTKCLSAKEALSKALGSGFRNNIFLKDITLYKNHLGRPSIYVSGKTKNFFFIKKIKKCKITITDENKYIISLVLIEHWINIICLQVKIWSEFYS